MIDISKNARFASNNFLETGFNSLVPTSIADGYFASDLYSDERSRTFKFAGRFLIELNVNDKLYIGASTYTVPAGNYSSAQDLADAINALIAATSITCEPSKEANAYHFKFYKFGSTFTLKLSTLTNAIWQTIGYNTGVDMVAVLGDTSYIANSHLVRLHWPYEEIKINLGYQAAIGFVGIIGDLTKEFKVPENAVVTFMANNVDDFTSPPVNKVLEWTKSGFFQFIDDLIDSNWQYVLIRINHPDGPYHSEIGYLYVGDYAKVPNRNLATGISIGFRDTSTISAADNGQQFTNKKSPYRIISGASVALGKPDDINFIKRIYYLKQTSGPFFVALDPKLYMSESIDEKTVFCRFSKEPDSQHVAQKYFNMSFELTEAF